jgi:hypothetical protein
MNKKILILGILLCTIAISASPQSGTDITRKAMLNNKLQKDMVVETLSDDVSQIKPEDYSFDNKILNKMKDTVSCKDSCNTFKKIIAVMMLEKYKERDSIFTKKLAEVKTSITTVTAKYNSFVKTLEEKSKKKDTSIKEYISGNDALLKTINIKYDALVKEVGFYSTNTSLNNLYMDTLRVFEDTRIIKKIRETDSSITKMTTDIYVDIKKVIKNNIKLKEYVKSVTEETEEAIDPQMNPGFLTNITTPQFIPSINLLATKTTVNQGSGSSVTFNLFASAPTDTNYLKSKLNYFIPTASNFGFGGHWVNNYIPAGKNPDVKYTSQISTRFDFYYLNKRVPRLDSSGNSIKNLYTIGLAHMVLGLEYSYKNLCTFYGNFNLSSAVNGRDHYEEYFSTNTDATPFFDIGLRTDFYLDKKSTDQHILFNLNFIIVSNSVKKLAVTNDYVIPTIGISYIKSIL